MKALHKEKLNGCKIKIHHDFDPVNPREEFDNLWTLAFFNHRRYTLGDQNWEDVLPAGAMEDAENALYRENGGEYWPDDFEIKWTAIQRQAKKGTIIARPVYMYDHSGLAFSLSNEGYPFNCPWDSGVIGWAILSKEKARKEWGVSRIGPKLMETLLSNAKGEIEEYEGYVNGEVYGYTVKKDGEEVDSCWGFYGTSGYDYALEQAREAAQGAE